MQFSENDMTFAICLARRYPDMGQFEIIDAISSFKKLAKKLHRLDENACNRELSDNEKKQNSKAETAVAELAKQFNATVEMNGDPRGYPFYLRLPKLNNLDRIPTNDLGQRGWGFE